MRFVQKFWPLLRGNDRVVGINRRNVDLVYANNPRKHFPFADDKLLAKDAMARVGVAVPETLAICRGLFEVESTLDALERLESFVVKPATGSGGDGILVVGTRIGPGRWISAKGDIVTREDLRKHLADIVFGAYSKQLEDVAFVEPRIVGHPAFAALWDEGLCDVRIIVLRGTPVVAMVRVPTRESGGRANLHQGGLGLAVDITDGRVIRAYHRGRPIDRHPESGAPLVGWVVPSFDDLIAIAKLAASSVPLGYLGVDLVVDSEGRPFVLEINARPGLEIQNVHGEGLVDAIEAAGESVVPPSRRARAESASPVPARVAGDSAVPILLFFGLLLASAIALEIVARRHEPAPIVVAIDRGADSVASDDDASTGDDAPTESGPADPDRMRGRALARRGELDDAIAAFRRSLERSPGDVGLRTELAFWLIAAHRPREARDELAVAASSNPDEPIVALYAGHALVALGDYPGAEREYRRALALRPGFDGAAIALARLLIRGRRFGEALAVVEPATRRGGNDERARALVVYGAASIRVGRRDRAEASFTRAIERAPSLAAIRIQIGRAWLESNDSRDVARAVASFESAARIAPDVATAQSGLGRAYEKAGDDAGAERAYERCLTIDPAYTYARRRLLRIALANREFRKAENQAARLLAEDPSDPEHHFLAGLVSAREGKLDDARVKYTAAIERANGDYPEAYFNLGQLENRSGRREEAIAAYEQAIAHRPTYVQAMNNLGLVLESAGRPADAEAEYRHAIAIEPRYATALLNLGTLLSTMGRNDEAIRTLEQALAARGGRHATTELELAKAIERGGRRDEACASLERLVAREPRLVAAFAALGDIRERGHELSLAAAAYRRALEVDPDNAQALASLGRVEAEIGDLAGARTHLSGSLDVDSSASRTRLALADVLRRLGDRAGCDREASVAASSPETVAAADALRRRCGAR